MARDETTAEHAVTEAMRTFALRYPGTTEAGACVNRAIKAGKKSFLFLGSKPTRYELRLKLGDSYGEAEQLASQEPERYLPGKHGWTLVRFGVDETPPDGLLERWIDESYRLLATKKLLAELPPSGIPK